MTQRPGADLKKIRITAAAIWSVISLIGGILFIIRYYEQGLKNPYCMKISTSGQITWAVIAYIFAVLIIYLICSFAVNAIFENGRERKIVMYALPFLLLFLAACAGKYFKLHLTPDTLIGFYDDGDERNIWDAAARLYPFFFVYTSELYLICFFVIPFMLAPTIIKITFEALVLGYAVFRIREHYDSRLAYLLYILLLMVRTVCGMGIRVHRMHWYGPLYLFFAVKLYFDSREGEGSSQYNLWQVLFMSVIAAILTVWRREGMYLFLFGAVEMILVYARNREKKVTSRNAVCVLLIFAVTQALFYLPAAKNGFGETGTTYGAFIVHMLGEESFDRDKVAGELEIVDKYMDIEIIDKYNSDLGIRAFEDCMYSWEDWNGGDYYAMRKDPGVTQDEFISAVNAIILKEPLVFLLSRFRAFRAASGLFSKNLFIPLAFLLVIFIYSIMRRNLMLFLLSGGVAGHTAITALTMPASYFKYFNVMILFSYVFIVVVITDLYHRRTQSAV